MGVLYVERGMWTVRGGHARLALNLCMDGSFLIAKNGPYTFAYDESNDFFFVFAKIENYPLIHIYEVTWLWFQFFDLVRCQ